MAFKVAIVDDDRAESAVIHDYLNKYSRETGDEFTSDFFEDGDTIALDYKPIYDIIFLDIEMELLDGMSTAKHIRRIDKNVVIIFITNTPQYAVKGYEVDALSYLLKPVSYFAFAHEVRRSVERLKKRRSAFILLTGKYGAERIETRDILFAESMKHKLIIYTVSQKYVQSGTMKDIERKLSDHGFFRCNNCYLVNLAAVTGVRDNTAFVGDFQLQISRPKKKAFMEALTAWFGEMKL